MAEERLTEEPASTIPIENFDYEVDSFDEWVQYFESAVVLATNCGENRKDFLFKTWLPLKVDSRTRTLLENCTATGWTERKAELNKLLRDPLEEYAWQSNRETVKWDGKESFHILERRVKRSVDQFGLGGDKKPQYFFRFYQALTTPYQEAIDMGCPEEKRTIEEAKRIAFRVKMVLANRGESSQSEGTRQKGASFIGAAAYENKIENLERRLNRLEMEMEDYRHCDCHHL